MSTQPFVIERIYTAPISLVWQAITDSACMKEWYFDLPGFRAEPGYEFSFMGGNDCVQYLHLCRVTEVIPLQKLSHTWRYEGYPGDSLVTWELFEDGDKTRVRLTHSGLESFGTTHPDLAPHNFATGWTSIFDRSLSAYLTRKV